jgi:AraC-like DNA-binding protein|tara:strand:+ start:39 stop:701 length:663 start_codon:yes stop_codon:yes gene_type:complete
VLYHRWEYSVTADETSIIQPDGCRDVILVSRPNEPDEIRITNWDSQPQAVRLLKGTKMVGYRLSPGTTIATTVLMNNDPNTFVLEGMIESEGTQSLEIFELIETLAQSNLTVQQVARQSGRTVRTLQRQFRDLSLPSPDYWRLLGRARRAAKALPCRVPLVEIAHEYGYSDQAHMTREFVRWFGNTPSRLRQDKVSIVEISQPGLGNWLKESRSEVSNLL